MAPNTALKPPYSPVRTVGKAHVRCASFDSNLTNGTPWLEPEIAICEFHRTFYLPCHLPEKLTRRAGAGKSLRYEANLNARVAADFERR